MINPGDLDQRLYFVITEGEDDDGFPTPEPIVYAKAWAALKTLKGNAFYTAAQGNMQHIREFKIRYQWKLDDEERPKRLQVKWKNKLHNIESIENDDGQNVTMTVRCRAVT